MQPALDETAAGCCTTERIFQRRQWTDHANEGLARNEQYGRQMRKPKPEIAHEPQPHPCADPYQREAYDHEQRKQEMDDKYEISHVTIMQTSSAKAKA